MESRRNGELEGDSEHWIALFIGLAKATACHPINPCICKGPPTSLPGAPSPLEPPYPSLCHFLFVQHQFSLSLNPTQGDLVLPLRVPSPGPTLVVMSDHYYVLYFSTMVIKQIFITLGWESHYQVYYCFSGKIPSGFPTINLQKKSLESELKFLNTYAISQVCQRQYCLVVRTSTNVLNLQMRKLSTFVNSLGQVTYPRI